MKKIYSLFLMLLCCMAAGAQTLSSLTKNDAYEFARNLVSDESGEYDYYICSTRLLMPIKEGASSRQISVYFVLVDEEPGSGWEHPCKYVFVPVSPVYKDYSIAVDTICPPAKMRLEPIYVPNRYGANATKKPAVEKDLSNAPNEAAGNTYAVILNGGMSNVANKEHYWNDCSFFYQTLRNKYDIPKSNIKVIMSDGTDEGNDLNLISGGYASSPLDLDGDGQPDIEYAATKENLQLVFSELAQKLTDNDHLLLFVTDHGGIDKTQNNKTYMYLWNMAKLYPEELAAYLEPIKAGFVSVVMGQCYSGGFIEALKDTNRIIATASSATEMSFRSTTVPFNEFLYHWTSALNGCDAFGNEADCGEALPITDAQLYAAKHDFWANEGTTRVKETPQISYFTNSVASDLTLANIPPTVDIVFDTYKAPVVSELVTKPYEVETTPVIKPSYEQDSYFAMPVEPFMFWQSPYIWVRNTNDGIANNKTERLIIEPDCEEKFACLYTQIRNRGVKPYNQKNQNIMTYWTPAKVTITESDWKGISALGPCGGQWLRKTISKTIQPGEHEIMEFMRTFRDEEELDTLRYANGNLCYLAFVNYKNSNGEMPVDSNRIAEVWNTNKLAQCNILYANAALLDTVGIELSNPTPWPMPAKLVLVEDNSIAEIFNKANVSLRMTKGLAKSWEDGGKLCTEIEEDKNTDGMFYLRATGSNFDNIILKPRQKARIGVKANFFANTSITERQQYDINIALVNNATGQFLGGETFRIIQEPRPAINPMVNTTMQSKGKTLLEATNVDEDVVYKWYDADGHLVGTGATFEVPAGAASTYTVRAEAVSDGAISDSAPVMAETSTIKAVDAQSSIEAVDVRFYDAVPSGVKLCLTSSDGITPASYYNVENGTTSYAIPATNLPSGIYQVTMIQNGTVTGVKKFVK